VVASKHHWQRYVVEAAPVLLLFAAVSIDALGGALTRRLHRGTAFQAIVTLLVLGVLVVIPIRDLVTVTRRDQRGTQRADARNWILHNVPAGSRVLQEPKLFNVVPKSIPPIGNGIRVDPVLDAQRQTLAEYEQQGYSYVVVSAGAITANLLSAEDPKVRQFYSDLGCETRLVAFFPRVVIDYRPISIYRLDERPTNLLDLFCRQEAPPSPTQ
jgi:hypothetical protein